MADDEREAAREAAARKQREQDRQDLWREEGGLPSGRLRRFIFDRENDPRTPEGQAKKRAEHAMIRAAEAIARWDAQRVTIGGVEMTNAEAQTARRRFLEDPDRWTRWARERGLIKPGQEQDLVRTMQEIHDLTEKERLYGDLGDDEKRRLQDLKDSPLGRVAGQATGHIHEAHKDMGVSMGPETTQIDSTMLDGASDGAQSETFYAALPAVGSAAPRVTDLFTTAPPLDPAFTAAKAATVPLDVKDARPADKQVASVTRSQGTGPSPGLDL